MCQFDCLAMPADLKASMSHFSWTWLFSRCLGWVQDSAVWPGHDTAPALQLSKGRSAFLENVGSTPAPSTHAMSSVKSWVLHQRRNQVLEGLHSASINISASGWHTVTIMHLACVIYSTSRSLACISMCRNPCMVLKLSCQCIIAILNIFARQ